MVRRLTFCDLEGVRRALAVGMRHVEIAREHRLGVWTVDRIAARERYARELLTEGDLFEDDAPPDYVPDDLRRCAGCGGMVYVWPCLACRAGVRAGSRGQGSEGGIQNAECRIQNAECRIQNSE
jgi:hypothetical protein